MTKELAIDIPRETAKPLLHEWTEATYVRFQELQQLRSRLTDHTTYDWPDLFTAENFFLQSTETYIPSMLIVTNPQEALQQARMLHADIREITMRAEDGIQENQVNHRLPSTTPSYKRKSQQEQKLANATELHERENLQRFYNTTGIFPGSKSASTISGLAVRAWNRICQVLNRAEVNPDDIPQSTNPPTRGEKIQERIGQVSIAAAVALPTAPGVQPIVENVTDAFNDTVAFVEDAMLHVSNNTEVSLQQMQQYATNIQNFDSTTLVHQALLYATTHNIDLGDISEQLKKVVSERMQGPDESPPQQGGGTASEMQAGEDNPSQTKQWSSVELQDGSRPREGDGLSDLFNRALRPEQEIFILDLPEGDWSDQDFLQQVKALLDQDTVYQEMSASAQALVQYVNSTGEATNAVSRDVIAPLPDGTILLTQWIEDDNGVAFIVIDEQGGMYAAIAPEKNTDILPAVASWDGQYAFVPLAVSKHGPIDLLIVNDDGIIEQVRLTRKQREEFGLALTSFSQEHEDLTPVVYEEDEEELLTPDQQFFANYEWNPATDMVGVTSDGETLQVTRDGETFNTPVIKVNITERHAGKELGFYQEHDGWHPTVGIYLSSSMVEETQDRIRLEGYISDNGPFLKIMYILPSRDGTDAIILVNTIGANLIYEGADITLGTRGDVSNGGPSSKAVSLQEAYNYLQNNYQPGGSILVQLPVFDERGDIMNVTALRQWWETGDRSMLPEEVQEQGYMVVLGRSTAINRLPQQQPAAVAQESS